MQLLFPIENRLRLNENLFEKVFFNEINVQFFIDCRRLNDVRYSRFKWWSYFESEFLNHNRNLFIRKFLANFWTNFWAKSKIFGILCMFAERKKDSGQKCFESADSLAAEKIVWFSSKITQIWNSIIKFWLFGRAVRCFPLSAWAGSEMKSLMNR